MPAKEINDLRKEGRLDEAFALAKKEFEEAIVTIPEIDQHDSNKALLVLANNAKKQWHKKIFRWVYYDYLKKNNLPEFFDQFLMSLNDIKNLNLPVDEAMLFDQVSWQVGKMGFALLRIDPVDLNKLDSLFETIKAFHFTKPSEGYSFLFKTFHKAYKLSDKYIEFADWWDLKNFRSEDFQMEKMLNGKEVMALAEQAYIAYAKHLLPKQSYFGETNFDRGKVEAFLPTLDGVIESYPQYQYPAYYKAKLLLSLGDKDHMLSALLPFAKKKKNDFWVWEILSEAFSKDPEKVLACHCRALSCTSPEEMLINLRQKMASIFIERGLFNEAKTEIEMLGKSRVNKGFKLPNEVVAWQNQAWYSDATVKSSNSDFYKQYTSNADELLFSDLPEEAIIVDFVNSDKKVLNFIASKEKLGFFKYDRFIKTVQIGDTLNVRFNGSGAENGNFQIFTLNKTDNHFLKDKFVKAIEGNIEIGEGKSFGFVDHVFIHPSIIKRFNLKNEQHIKAMAINSYQTEKMQWSWKVYDVLEGA